MGKPVGLVSFVTNLVLVLYYGAILGDGNRHHKTSYGVVWSFTIEDKGAERADYVGPL